MYYIVVSNPGIQLGSIYRQSTIHDNTKWWENLLSSQLSLSHPAKRKWTIKITNKRKLRCLQNPRNQVIWEGSPEVWHRSPQSSNLSEVYECVECVSVQNNNKHYSNKVDIVCRKRAVSNSRPACREAFLNFMALGLLFFLLATVCLCYRAYMPRNSVVRHTRILYQNGWTCHRNSFTIW